MRARRLTYWAVRLAAVAALGAGVALTGNAVANADISWGSHEETTGDTTVDGSSDTPLDEEGASPEEPRWDGTEPSGTEPSGGWSVLLEPRWD